MGGRSRHSIFSGRIIAVKVAAEHAAREAVKAIRERDRTACLLWSEQMEGFGGPAQPSPTIAQCLSGGYGWLEIMCKRCETTASIPLDAIRRPRETPIRKLETSFRCRSCGTSRHRPPVRLIRLAMERSVRPYRWVHPDEDERH
ncbi:hypothetical protein G6321_00046090 [Bradyrhizobium barranii subsp. barranii]|uniref:Uncharacterized protein n=1 Tax=Bradyrhizobium barranii subsp. barranii TaxID=2823807 RepID=A0A9X9YPR8_9BRAD|nr:hypothetical protein G6321_00046090 [Bradyrhizobium barranii subsp. barranii]